MMSTCYYHRVDLIDTHLSSNRIAQCALPADILQFLVLFQAKCFFNLDVISIKQHGLNTISILHLIKFVKSPSIITNLINQMTVFQSVISSLKAELHLPCREKYLAFLTEQLSKCGRYPCTIK